MLSMEWIRKGNIFNDCHAQVPVVDTNHDGFWRIYYSKRENRGPSLPYYLDVEAGNPQNILRYSAEPILSPGNKGMFDNDSFVVLIFPDHGSRYMSKIYSDDWMKEQGFYDPDLPQNKPSTYI